MTKKHAFTAGNYYIGDPCYAVKDEKWDSLIDETGCFGLEDGSNWDDGKFLYNASRCFASGTQHGDGVYDDNSNRVYGVDAGLIGIIPESACDGDSLDGGNFVTFDEDFLVYEDDGVFHFGNVVIDTN